jgi:hypothetical protein
MIDDFVILGDRLEAAARRRIETSGKRRRRAAVTAATVVATMGLLVGVSTAAGVGPFDLRPAVQLPPDRSYQKGETITLPDGTRCVVDLKQAVDQQGVPLGDHFCYPLPPSPKG